MAIIVNKEEKRRNIALSCQNLLLEHGIENLTISQIAKTAGVGKGTIYEYFKNKEDIVFEIITTFIAQHEARLEEVVVSDISLRQKLYHFFHLLFENEEAQRHLMLYKEFLAISLLHENSEMLAFSEACHQTFLRVIDTMLASAVETGELPQEHHICSRSLLLFATGLVVDSRMQWVNVGEEIALFLDMLLGKESQ